MSRRCGPVPVPPGQAALLLQALQDLRIRDLCCGWSDELAAQLPTDLIRVTARGQVPAVATLIATTVYQRGNTALAQIAVDHALGIDPSYGLARLLHAGVRTSGPLPDLTADLHDWARAAAGAGPEPVAGGRNVPQVWQASTRRWCTARGHRPAAVGVIEHAESRLEAEMIAMVVRVDQEQSWWRGAVIAEGLHDPTLINGLRVYQARMSKSELPLDGQARGRWHLYWVQVTGEQLDQVQSGTKHEWYAHFWQGDRLVVCFDDARFDLDRSDRVTWQPAIEHGLGQGLRPEWLDFPTDDGARELEP